jgi:hypothetical protein
MKGWRKHMRFLRVVFCCLLAGSFVHGSSAFSQPPAPAARIVDRIDESQLITLKGNTHPAAVNQNDRGEANPNLAMTDLILVLRRGPEQQAEFDQFVAGQYDPSSPNFHSWLAPADVGRMFGPSVADIATISSWLAGHGLRVDEVSPDRMTIRFSGAAEQVQSAFHVEIHNLLVNGEPHVANMSDPRIPAALAPVVAGVKALHNFFPRPQHTVGGRAIYDKGTSEWLQAPNALANGTSPGVPRTLASASTPEFGYTTDGFTYEDVAPYDFATIYSLLPLWSANIDGTGQTIAIAGTSDINAADVASFRSAFGLPAGTPPTTIVANGTDPGECLGSGLGLSCTLDDLVENTLDVEWSGAVAKGASIMLVVSGSNSTTTDTVYSSADYVVQNMTANILSVSYGECELGEGTSGNAAYNNLWETAASEGIAVFVAAGDAGSATCDQDLATSTPYAANYGLSVSGIASTPYDTAVGGTDLNWGSTPSPYWGATDNASNHSDALGYIPEVPWNDTCTNPLTLNDLQEWAAALVKAGFPASSPYDAESACNFVNEWWNTIYTHTNPAANISGFLNVVGGGGGASNCTTSNGSTVASCAGGYAKPSWQSGVPGIPADGARDLPDVSFFAGNGFLGTSYLICESVKDACSYSSSSEPVGEEVGGTSVGTPAMAGVMALINQKAGVPQGNPNAELYALAAKQSYGNCSAETGSTNDGCAFNDIDTGTIAMPCTLNSPNCTVTHAGDDIGILSGYGATTGFDAATGLGSLNIANVVNAWTSTVGTASATVTVTPAQTSFPLNQSLSVSVTVSGSIGTPTGTVSLRGGGYTATAGTLSGGSYTFTIPADALSTGADTLKMSYSGDATYARASGSASVTVAKLTSTVTVGPPYGELSGTVYEENVAVTVTGAGPAPTGTVTMTAPGYSSPCSLSAPPAFCSVFIPGSDFPIGTNTVTANYSGDSNYLAGTGTVTIIKPAVTLTTSPTNPTTADTVQLTVNVTGTGPAPTGYLELFGAQYFGPGAALSGGSYTFMLTPGSLVGGTDTLTVVYPGDSTYSPSIATTTVTLSKVTPTITITPSATSISSNLPLTVTGTVTGAGLTASAGGNVTISANALEFEGPVSSGAYSITIPAGSLSAGTVTLTASYSGDPFNTTASNSTTVTVTQWVQVASTVKLTPTLSTVDTGQTLPLAIAVTGALGPPTGTVTISGGGYTGPAWPLNNGSTTFTIPVNSMSAGTDTLTASYSGDPTYLPSTATTQITVTQSGFTLTASTPAEILPGGLTQSTITAITTTGYTGLISFTCVLTSQPSGAQYLPTCAPLDDAGFTGGGGTSVAEIDVSTTAATAALTHPMLRTRGSGWTNAGGMVLALVILLGIPARRRNWRSMLGLLVLLAVFGGLSACGGSNSSGCGSGGCGGGNSGTTAGTYTFTVTGVGNPAVTPAPTTTFTVTVN